MAGKMMRPSELDVPALMMCFPFTVSNDVANNVLMTDRRPYNLPRAFRQWLELYNKLAEHAVVYLMPHDNLMLQDLTFVANVGAVLPHDDTIVLLANFKSEPRRGEEKIAWDLFEKMGYKIRRPTHYWEGEADLKFIRDNLYVGGYGIRSEHLAYLWMHEFLDMNVISVEMNDAKLYHLDCIYFQLDDDRAVVATDALAPADIRLLERHVEIIGVPPGFLYDGWTNAVRIGKTIYLNVPPTRESMIACTDFYVELGFEPRLTDLGEFDKSGADLSCLVMHLNHRGRR
jgi:N-dimethylarginine dimethylaminohydrolase